MNPRLSTKILRPDFQGEFTASILAAAASPDLISFAGGLPNPVSFPVEAMDKATHKVLEKNGVMALQYSGTQGYLPLREWVAKRYETMGVYGVTADDIIITNGSQQVLTMIGACMLDPGDKVIVENPTYLVALQSFHFFDPEILPVTINPDGIDCDELAATVQANPDAKFAYVIPNFQNPTGLTYTQAVRERAAEILKAAGTPVIEDNPYGELRFHGEGGSSFAALLGEQCAAMGTFSKIVAPGMRIGWIACKQPELYAKLLAFKSTMDLHTNIFGQMVLAEYLLDNDLDDQIDKIKDMYREKAEKMMACMAEDFPAEVSYTKPEGGMFIWATMPEGLKAVDVMEAAAAKGVAVCPGDPFYEEERGVRTMRINYSNSSDEAIEKGIKILGDTIKELLAK